LSIVPATRLVERDLERLEGGVDGAVGGRVAPAQGQDVGLEPVEGRGQALDRLARARDRPDVGRFAAFQQQRQPAAEDVEPGRQLLRLVLPGVERVPLELVDEAQVLDLGLRRHPQVRHELVGEHLVLDHDLVRADHDRGREQQEGGGQGGVLVPVHGLLDPQLAQLPGPPLVAVRESWSSRYWSRG
jgi:hypothetical protein